MGVTYGANTGSSVVIWLYSLVIIEKNGFLGRDQNIRGFQAGTIRKLATIKSFYGRHDLHVNFQNLCRISAGVGRRKELGGGNNV